MKINIIVAIDKNNGIGIENRLPWSLPEDLIHFKKTTSGKPIIMGSKTFESIGRPLPNRMNIVLTTDEKKTYPGVVMANSIDEALEVAGSSGGAEVYVIGGGNIYGKMLEKADRLVVTHVDQKFDCDAFFPAIDGRIWEVEKTIPMVSAVNSQRFSITEYVRRS